MNFVLVPGNNLEAINFQFVNKFGVYPVEEGSIVVAYMGIIDGEYANPEYLFTGSEEECLKYGNELLRCAGYIPMPETFPIDQVGKDAKPPSDAPTEEEIAEFNDSSKNTVLDPDIGIEPIDFTESKFIELIGLESGIHTRLFHFCGECQEEEIYYGSELKISTELPSAYCAICHKYGEDGAKGLVLDVSFKSMEKTPVGVYYIAYKAEKNTDPKKPITNNFDRFIISESPVEKHEGPVRKGIMDNLNPYAFGSNKEISAKIDIPSVNIKSAPTDKSR